MILDHSLSCVKSKCEIKITNWSNSDCANLAPIHFIENIALFSIYGHNPSRNKSCLIDQKTSAQLNWSLINLSGKECKQGPFFLGSSRSRRQLFLPRRHQPKINVLSQFYIQLVFKAPLCITLTISDQKIVSGSLIFQLFQKTIITKAILWNFSMRLLKWF